MTCPWMVSSVLAGVPMESAWLPTSKESLPTLPLIVSGPGDVEHVVAEPAEDGRQGVGRGVLERVVDGEGVALQARGPCEVGGEDVQFVEVGHAVGDPPRSQAGDEANAAELVHGHPDIGHEIAQVVV